jgi:hypothetical protein
MRVSVRIVLANSRAMWAEFAIDLTVHSLCRSLVRGARALGGVARQWLFDNPKVVVLERIGTVARFHPTLLALCAAMRVEPKLCAVRKPRQKGKVERAIRYLRDRFLAGRTITGIDEGNRLLARFIDEIAHVRPHPTIAQRTVGEVFSDERARLLALPSRFRDRAHRADQGRLAGVHPSRHQSLLRAQYLRIACCHARRR